MHAMYASIRHALIEQEGMQYTNITNVGKQTLSPSCTTLRTTVQNSASLCPEEAGEHRAIIRKIEL